MVQLASLLCSLLIMSLIADTHRSPANTATTTTAATTTTTTATTTTTTTHYYYYYDHHHYYHYWRTSLYLSNVMAP